MSAAASAGPQPGAPVERKRYATANHEAQLVFRVPQHLKDGLDRIAEATGSTRSKVVRKALEQYVSDHRS